MNSIRPFKILEELGNLKDLFNINSEAVFLVNDEFIYNEYVGKNPHLKVLMFTDIEALTNVDLVGGELYKKRLTGNESLLIMHRVMSRVGSLEFLKQL